MRSSDWSSDVCSSDLPESHRAARGASTVEGRRRLSSVGRPLSILELEIRDENARLVPAGTVGEIWVRGDQVSGEYAGRKVIGDDGWFPTNDRKSVVSGKSVSVRVDLGGRRIIKKKKDHKRNYIS